MVRKVINPLNLVQSTAVKLKKKMKKRKKEISVLQTRDQTIYL